MSKLIILRGLPCSGKSTYAAQLVQIYGYKRLNKDDMRMMIDNSIYSRTNEKLLNELMHSMMCISLKRGYDVVLDNCNFSYHQVQQAINRASQYGPEVIFKDFDVPVEECIKRDLKRDQGRVGKEVIMRMYNKYFKDGKFPDDY